MTEPAISSFDVPALEALPVDLRERIEAVRAKTGFVPNVFLVLARRPDEFRAFFAYYDAVMLRQGGLTKAEKEMIVVATSAANQCPYCVIAHGALVRLFSKNPRLGDQIAVNYRQADLAPRQRLMARSPRCSHSLTVWRISQICGRTTNSSPWAARAADPARESAVRRRHLLPNAEATWS